jgi:hypothetical protein
MELMISLPAMRSASCAHDGRIVALMCRPGVAVPHAGLRPGPQCLAKSSRQSSSECTRKPWGAVALGVTQDSHPWRNVRALARQWTRVS